MWIPDINVITGRGNGQGKGPNPEACLVCARSEGHEGQIMESLVNHFEDFGF